MISIEAFKEVRASRHLLILDTSILLELYRQPSNISLDVIDVLEQVIDNLYIPYQVYDEFCRNYQKICGDEKKKYKKVRTELTDSVSNLQSEINRKIAEYRKHNYTDITKLQNDISEKMEATKSIIDEYETAHQKEIKANLDFLNNDTVKTFVEELKRKNRIGQQIPFSEKISIIREGELRFKNLIPPGYKDNEKKGADKFGDLFIWKTILKLAKDETSNIIFITNDVKEDWWKQGKDEPIELRNELLDEFKEINPHLEIYFLTLERTFSYLSEELQRGNSKSALQLSATEVVREFVDETFKEDIEKKVKGIYEKIDINNLLDEEFFEVVDEEVYWNVENVSVEKQDKIITYFIDLDISVVLDLMFREPGDYPYYAGKAAISLNGDMSVTMEEYSTASQLEQLDVQISEHMHIEPKEWKLIESVNNRESCKKIIAAQRGLERYEESLAEIEKRNGSKHEMDEYEKRSEGKKDTMDFQDPWELLEMFQKFQDKFSDTK